MKSHYFVLKFLRFFFEQFFVEKKIKIFDEIFFKVHLLCLENRSEAVLERFRQFKGKKTQGQEVVNRN